VGKLQFQGLALGIAPTRIIDIVGAILYGCPSFDKIPFNDPSAENLE